MTLGFRQVLLSCEGVVEGAHMGHPDFRLHGRVFASLSADETRGTVKLAPAEQALLVAEAPRVVMPAAGAWGRQGWTSITLAEADPAVVRSACVLAWEAAAAAPARRPRSRARR